MSKGKTKILFDVQVDTGNGGMLLCAMIEPKIVSSSVGDIAMIAPTEKGTKMSLMKAHRLLRHPNEDLTRSMAAHLGWEIRVCSP